MKQAKSQRPQGRKYDNRLRLEQAEANQHRIVAAARTLFVEQGYLATTMADVAAGARVSVPTVYKAFPSKGALAEHAYPTLDAEPLRAVLIETRPVVTLERYAALARGELERIGAIAAAVHVGAAAGDPELRVIVEQRDRERSRRAGQVARHLAALGALRPGMGVEQARDVLWYLVAPEAHLLLVGRRGWTYARLERWFVESMTAAVLDMR